MFELPGAENEPRPPVALPNSAMGPEPAIMSEAELCDLERRNTLAALNRCGWKVNGPGGAARLLGLKPTTLMSRIKKLGLQKPGSALVTFVPTLEPGASNRRILNRARRRGAA